MSKNTIIEYLYKMNVVKMYGWKQLARFNKDKQEDLIQEVWLNIAMLPESVLLDLWNQGKNNLTAYIKRFITNQLSITGRTRKLQQLITIEVPVDFDEEITKEDNDEIPVKKYKIENDIDYYETRN